ncbi:unnamed protein product [Mytilus edulis]|uniref:Endonuclease/exonuclease/phosphatase domain-containing protein n=1 Tax=Mytilus edulis TaxID=6550 RepID=A0A8S3QRV8_MYTED|nr:unnamed protein product [Mytilus edulis]
MADLNDSGSKQYSLPPTLMQACTNQYSTPNLNDTPLSSNVISTSRQILYGADNGYAFTPYHLQAPHTTPAQMGHQTPSVPIPMMHPISTPPHPDLLMFMHEVREKLQKLDILEDILSRLVDMEEHCNKLDSEICGIKTDLKAQTSNIVSLDKGLGGLHSKLQEIETQNITLTDENYKLQEKIIDQQKRSMRDNLIFKGIYDDHDPTENTEETVKDFIKTELGLESKDINFHVVHRLRPRQDRGPRNILAKFERRKDRNRVLEAAKKELKQKPQYYVHEQFPVEIIERRRELIPILKDAREKGHEAVLVEDKLFINKRRFDPRQCVPQINQQHQQGPRQPPSDHGPQQPPSDQHTPMSSKLKFTEFSNIFQTYDVLVFVETKLDDLDIIDLPDGFSYVTKNRKGATKKSGGIVIIYKNILKQFISFIESESQYVQWFKFQKCLLNCEKDVLFGAVYIPPENSKYANTDAFEEIEIELLTFADKFDSYVSLIGDFNAKTGTRDDFIVPDESLIGIFELESDDEILSYMLDYEQLKLQNIPLSRMSECHCNINNYGHKLLDMCKKLNVYIANSRLGSDIGIGRTTCKDISVIDYLLLSSKLFSLVDEFEILDFVPLFSDVHNAIHIVFKSVLPHDEITHDTSQNSTSIKWNDNNRNEFVNTFHNSQDQLTNIMNDLENIHTRDTCTQQDIDNITGEINELFQNTAKATLSKPHYKSRKKPNSKPWYTNKCLTSRKKFHKARKRYNIHKNEVTRKQLLETSKSYKMVTNQAYKNYQFDFEQKLRNTSKKQGKEFWKILNKFVKNKDEKSEISVETLHDYFKSMNENNVHDEIDIDIDVNNLPPDIEELLNSPITVEEIKCAFDLPHYINTE